MRLSEENVVVRKGLDGSGLTKGDCPLLSRMPVAAVRNAVASARERRCRSVPLHPTIHIGVAFVIAVAIKLKFLGPVQASAAVLWGVANASEIQFGDGCGTVIGDFGMFAASPKQRIT